LRAVFEQLVLLSFEIAHTVRTKCPHNSAPLFFCYSISFCLTDLSFDDDRHTAVAKGSNVGQVPNVANEATTYLFYIIKYYYTLPRNIIFVHDNEISLHHYGKITTYVHAWIREYERHNSTYYEFNDWDIKKSDAEINNTGMHDFYTTCMEPVVGPYHLVEPNEGKCCAQFIVSSGACPSSLESPCLFTSVTLFLPSFKTEFGTEH